LNSPRVDRMRWDVVAAPDLVQDLILFDGDCVLCSRWARFVHARDIAARFRFVAIQSPFGHALAERFGINTSDPDTNLAVIAGRVFFKSDTALAILRALPGWGWASIALIVPRPVRNWFYDRVARNRYRWFGRRERCWAGDPAFRHRIIETAP
jgi:predicted DCC family thiol-disulfide oxidoreductase YuxK